MSKIIENIAKVYLHRDVGDTEWEIDPTSYDGYPFDGYDRGDGINDNDDLRDEVEAAKADLNKVDVPDADKLLHLLADALGYTVTKIEGTDCLDVIPSEARA